MYEDLKEQAKKAAEQVLEMSGLKEGQIVVIGCSTSEIVGERMGTHSVPEVATAVFDEIYKVFSRKGVYVAAQCCEHLNRAIITEREAAKGLDIVNVIPQPKAGGSFATAAYNAFKDPVALEEILKLTVRKIGEANLSAARVRPKFIGGCRAVYDENML